jgi:5'(3')-deoxyribonucleotidase
MTFITGKIGKTPYICSMKTSDKKRVYVDMDGVLCNFYKAAKQALTENPNQKYPQSQWGFFLKLEEIPGAIEGFRKLEEKYDLWILTRPSFRNVNCYTEKAQWIWDHLGFDVVEKTIMCGDKSLLKGDYLIDDMDGAGQSSFEGEWIHFRSERFPDWKAVMDYLIYLD